MASIKILPDIANTQKKHVFLCKKFISGHIWNKRLSTGLFFVLCFRVYAFAVDLAKFKLIWIFWVAAAITFVIFACAIVVTTVAYTIACPVRVTALAETNILLEVRGVRIHTLRTIGNQWTWLSGCKAICEKIQQPRVPCNPYSACADQPCHCRRSNHLCPTRNRSCCCCRRRYRHWSNSVSHTLHYTLVSRGPNTRIFCKTCNHFFYLRTSGRESTTRRSRRKKVFDVPQQSPPSQSHAQLLFSSSQFLSPFQSGEPHLPFFFGHFFTSALQSLHLHSVLTTLHHRVGTFPWFRSVL